ncbi:hypothetical protein Niako_0496 [Niastella koreensis GR20-10]|uniref:Uncharacterized protein n=1 Tax=Niastella koreensis (strain DSM 17620 / KACC 11465 / NBRC 106392 / GR20-10) TaxID=700598 RepID=G8T6P8_NIAKG|nr:hypothetical protein Niako_0496 [Niastella koreensis GR20-10]
MGLCTGTYAMMFSSYVCTGTAGANGNTNQYKDSTNY